MIRKSPFGNDRRTLALQWRKHWKRMTSVIVVDDHLTMLQGSRGAAGRHLPNPESRAGCVCGRVSYASTRPRTNQPRHAIISVKTDFQPGFHVVCTLVRNPLSSTSYMLGRRLVKRWRDKPRARLSSMSEI